MKIILKPGLLTFICLLLISCGVRKEGEIVSKRDLSEFEFVNYASVFEVQSFTVTAQEKARKGSKGGVRHLQPENIYLFGAPIEYEVRFSIKLDSTLQRKRIALEIDKINIIKIKTAREINMWDTLAYDTILIQPVFKSTNTPVSQSQQIERTFRFSHFSSSGETNVIIKLKNSSATIRTRFVKSLVPGG